MPSLPSTFKFLEFLQFLWWITPLFRKEKAKFMASSLGSQIWHFLSPILHSYLHVKYEFLFLCAHNLFP